jgi:hypothetical protein
VRSVSSHTVLKRSLTLTAGARRHTHPFFASSFAFRLSLRCLESSLRR